MPRPKGSPNKITQETKDFIQGIITKEHPRIESALGELYTTNKSHYMHVIIKLLPFITPKATEMTINTSDLPLKAPSWFSESPLKNPQT